jgi:hypothetical protein
MRHPAIVRRLIVASAFVGRDGLADDFWNGMERATADDMPEPYKNADRRLNPEPGHLGELGASDGDLRTMHATVPYLLRFLDE